MEMVELVGCVRDVRVAGLVIVLMLYICQWFVASS